MNTKDQIIELIGQTKVHNYFSKADTADRIVSLLNREHMQEKRDSILTIEAICQQYENFLLHDEKSYNNSVIIRGRYHDDAFFVLRGSYHLQITCTSLCGNYIHTAYDADYERNYTKGWEVVETFTSQEELELFTALNNEVAYKYYFGNGMTAYVLDVHLEFKKGDVRTVQRLYYIDEDTGFVYEEFELGFNPDNTQPKIVPVADTSECYLDEDGEETYYQLQFGEEGLKEHVTETWHKGSLSHMYYRIETKLTKLGRL